MQNRPSLETILTTGENKDTESQWSFVWSTTHLPTATTRPRRRNLGRRRLRRASLAIACLLCMHCRVGAAAVSGSFFIFVLLLVPCVAVLANPLRHFEVYLGQWSISGPGRAFRVVPMFEGIGLLMCINALIRAICYVVLAAIAGIYVAQGVSDESLPFTYCRDFKLKTYNANIILAAQSLKKLQNDPLPAVLTVSLENVSRQNVLKSSSKHSAMCNEVYADNYPLMYKTPPYNYFYVEVMRYIPGRSFISLNFNLIWSTLIAWALIWLAFFGERCNKGKIGWNNVNEYYFILPCLWVLLLITTSTAAFLSRNDPITKTAIFKTKDVIASLCDAFLVSLYIHGASVGTELIYGKGLNHYALGHVDPKLNADNVYHSIFVMVIAVLNSMGSAICALVDHKDLTTEPYHKTLESTLWIIPMYSKCTASGKYSHLRTSLIFAGLGFSYIFVAYTYLKTVIHVIFEYKVKLVYIENVIIAIVVTACAAVSLIFSTTIGLPLLESVDAFMNGLILPFICLLELLAILYMYQSHDFLSDMHISTEENTCATRIGIQWQIIPFLIAVVIVIKTLMIYGAELPTLPMSIAMSIAVIFALIIPMRSAFGLLRLFKPKQESTRGHIPWNRDQIHIPVNRDHLRK